MVSSFNLMKKFNSQMLGSNLGKTKKKSIFDNGGNDDDDEIRFTPLHIAFQNQNSKSINLILKYLSYLDYSQFNTFKVLMA